MDEVREAVVTAAYNIVTGNDGDWNPDRTLGALEGVWVEARAEGIRQAREAVALRAPTGDGSYEDDWDRGYRAASDANLRAIDALGDA